MIFLKRRRLVLWILRAYLKRWGKTIFISFFIGVLVFLILLLNLNFILSKFPIYKSQSIGLSGVYTLENLPPVVLDSISRGLTKIDKEGNVSPDVASSWQIKDNGKTYIFKLKNDIRFVDGKPLTASLIDYNFADAKVEKPDQSTIVFRLNDIYDTNMRSRDHTDLKNFKNASVEMTISSSKLVTLFFNTTDPLMSDKKLRKALSYSLPQEFSEGKRTNAPYPKEYWVNAGFDTYEKDLDYSSSLLKESSSSSSAEMKISIKTLAPYENTARKIASSWKKLGISVDIQVVEGIPSDYQAFLGEFLEEAI